ncbi:MAG: crotonobetainyl-CoA--carnitine CoA-transferase [Proteobacteria bacterium]|nr:MAG: crotonobetainyl-CoA--carnitine CoA-transferase [Pseudomonadota bacterium]
MARQRPDGTAPLVGTNATSKERDARAAFFKLFRDCPIPAEEQLMNLGLFLKRQDLSRLLFFHDLYQKIINVHGVIIEFGVRWGQTLALMQSFRGIYEPYNYNRKIIGFDTFSGFPGVSEQDGAAAVVTEGAYSVTDGYENYLAQVLDYHEQQSPISHLKKYELVVGDATVELPRYLEEHPETVVALAYFDLDLYEPTRACLEALKPHLTRGTVLGFDELNFPSFPGETIALREVLGLDRYAIQRSPHLPVSSYLVVE